MKDDQRKGEGLRSDGGGDRLPLFSLDVRSHDATTCFLLGGCCNGIVGSLKILFDLTHEIKERGLNIGVGFGRGLEKGASKRRCQILSFRCHHLSFVFEIALVAQKDKRDLVSILDTKDVVSECCDSVKGGTRSDVVNEEKAVSRPHERVSCRIEFIRWRVEDIENDMFIVNSDNLDETLFDGGIVLLNKVVVFELNAKGRLSHTLGPKDRQLELGHLAVVVLKDFGEEEQKMSFVGDETENCLLKGGGDFLLHLHLSTYVLRFEKREFIERRSHEG